MKTKKELEIENEYLRQRLADIHHFATSDMKFIKNELWEDYCQIRACISVMSDLQDIDDSLKRRRYNGSKPYYPSELYKEWSEELLDEK